MADKKVVFTNGCFDILHVGHVRYLEKARLMGDALIVGLNTDRSFEMVKGRKPYMPEDERREMLEALWAVDEVVLFDEETPLELIEEIKPNILVKGSDHDPETVIGREYAGEVRCIDVGADVHTTDIIKKIKESTP
jgi:rfaE bifunctional protein nucleotidyltransferase chain/domain